MHRRYAIKLNRQVTRIDCAVCGTYIEPDIGPELFLSDSWQLVCRPCGRKEAPELASLLALAEASTLYAIALLESGDRLTTEDLD